MNRRLTPSWYAFIILFFLCIGFLNNTILLKINQPNYIFLINIINLSLTYFWIIFNIIMMFFFFFKKYESKSFIMPLYFILINTLNLLNVFNRYYTNYDMLIYISYITKLFELTFVIYILYRNYQYKKK